MDRWRLQIAVSTLLASMVMSTAVAQELADLILGTKPPAPAISKGEGPVEKVDRGRSLPTAQGLSELIRGAKPPDAMVPREETLPERADRAITRSAARELFDPLADLAPGIVQASLEEGPLPGLEEGVAEPTRAIGRVEVVNSGPVAEEGPSAVMVVSPSPTVAPSVSNEPDIWVNLPDPGLELGPGGLGGPAVTSNVGIALSGNLSLVALASTSRPFVPWNPLFMMPESPFGLSTNGLELHGRQSSLQAAFRGPSLADWETGGLIKLFLQAGSLTSDTYGVLPVVAFGEIKNEEWRVSAGLQPDLFAPRDPTVIPTVLLGGSGNPGTFRGQFRIERTLRPSDNLQSKWQFALSDPLTTVLIDNTRRTTEGNGWPNVESRVSLGLGAEQGYAGGRVERDLEIGLAGVVGQLRNTQLVFDIEDLDPLQPPRRVIDVWGVSLDGKLNLTHRMGVSAEFFTGSAIGSYAANIFQSFDPDDFYPVRGSGGWVDAFYYCSDQVHVHLGYGLEVPDGETLGPKGISRNETYYTTMVWDVSERFQIGLEADYRQTDYVTLAGGQGAVLISQLLWRF
jgi:hypothetical protein